MASFHKSKLMPIGVFILLTSLVIVGVVVAVFIRPLEKLGSSKDAVSNGNQAEQENSYVTVSIKYGDIRGLTYRVTHEESIDVFLGVPFAKPPVGELRFSRPQPVSPWKPKVKDATRYGKMCVQQRTQIYNLTTASEDCLYLNIYTPRQSSPRSKRSSNTSLPVMLYVHGGSFRNGDSIYFNYTNLALKGVVVVTTNYRLDGLGFLSTQDDVIPGNFGLLDTGLALEFVKEIIGNFRGNPSQITMFGASAGSALVTQMALSPLTKGKFQKAILQSGPGTSYWASYRPGGPNSPRKVAMDLGARLQCDIPPGLSGEQQSLALLTCLRNATAHELITQIHKLTVQDYNSDIIFEPVSGDAFGVLPQPPNVLADNYTSMVPIPAIFGWSTNDSSWTIADPGDKGEDYDKFLLFAKSVIACIYPGEVNTMLKKVLEIYNVTEPTELSPYDVRSIDAVLRTDLEMESFIVKEARQFSKFAAGTFAPAKTFVYQYDHRPSYNTDPLWQGVHHMDEVGMVLGLPNGPNPLTYPVTSEDDRTVSELMTTMWSNFAKFGDPTPEPLGGVKWPEFGHTSDHQGLLVIRPELEVKEYVRNDPVVFWTGSSGLDD